MHSLLCMLPATVVSDPLIPQILQLMHKLAVVQEDVPQPPADELLALAELHAARKVLQAQALRESRKVS